MVEIVGATGSALAAMTGAIEGLTVYPERMRANLAAAPGAGDCVGAAEEFRKRLLEDDDASD